jgi:hypothetical protein
MTCTQTARIKKTKLFHADRNGFVLQLANDIQALQRRAKKKGLEPAVRLNGTSDLPWEKYPVTVDGVRHANLMAAFPETQYYDYTKITKRALRFAAGDFPPNYHLTYSLSEVNEEAAGKVLTAGCSVAVVFGMPLPHWDVVGEAAALVTDGDLHDVRFRDRGVIVGLKAKGRARHDTSGFVRG